VRRVPVSTHRASGTFSRSFPEWALSLVMLVGCHALIQTAIGNVCKKEASLEKPTS
jgi:hypothetical protein